MSKKVWMILVALLTTVAASACGEDAHDHDGELSEEAFEAFEEAYNEANDGKADSGGCSGVKVPDRGTFNKQVALTFDDGPNASTTPELLDMLKERGIKATFFINGNRVNSNTRPILQRMIDEGHILANHSHEHKKLTSVNSRTLDEQIRLTDNIIAEFTDQKYFRFPFGASNCTTAEHVRSYGYTITGWHIDSGDWCYASSGKGGVGKCYGFSGILNGTEEDMVTNTLSQIRSHEGGVALFHDIHAFTVSQMPAIMDKLIDEGYTFVNIDDVEIFPKLNGDFTPAPFVGDTCADDTACGFNDGFCHLYPLTDTEEVAGFCSVKCEGFCPDAPGKAGTFCTSLDGGLSGQCLSVPDASNNNCEALIGTKATEVERFVGASNAPLKTNTVCLPTF